MTEVSYTKSCHTCVYSEGGGSGGERGREEGGQEREKERKLVRTL